MRNFCFYKNHYILINDLFKTNTSWSTNICVSYKFFDGEKCREGIRRVIDYYIELNNIAYINGVEEEEEENDHQVSEDEIKKEWWWKVEYRWYINKASWMVSYLSLFL